jgi:hypothetical protein
MIATWHCSPHSNPKVWVRCKAPAITTTQSHACTIDLLNKKCTNRTTRDCFSNAYKSNLLSSCNPAQDHPSTSRISVRNHLICTNTSVWNVLKRTMGAFFHKCSSSMESLWIRQRARRRHSLHLFFFFFLYRSIIIEPDSDAIDSTQRRQSRFAATNSDQNKTLGRDTQMPIRSIQKHMTITKQVRK